MLEEEEVPAVGFLANSIDAVNCHTCPTIARLENLGREGA